MRSLIPAGAAILGAGLVYLSPLVSRDLFMPDEYRYAEIPREMLQSGDWIVPRLCGLRYFEKPPLGYWLTAVSLRLFGQNNFAVRLPAALAALFTAALLGVWGREVHRDRRWRWIPAYVFLSSLLPAALATINILDMPLTFFLTASVTALFLAQRTPSRPRRRCYLLLGGAAAGGAFLVKGFLAFAVPLLALAPFLLWERRWRDAVRMWFIPALAVLVTVLPWAIAVHLREADYWRYFILVEHLRRFFGGVAQHAEPVWFYLPVLLWAILPWTLVLPAAVRGSPRERPAFRLALGWFLFPLLFFSVSRGKVATYLLPALPPLAILISAGLERYFLLGRTRSFRRGGLIISLIAGLAALALAFLHRPAFSFPPFPIYPAPRLALIIFCLAAWSVFSLLAAGPGEPRMKVIYFGLGPLLLLGFSGRLVPEEYSSYKSPRRLLERMFPAPAADASLYVSGDTAAAVCWHYSRADENIILLGRSGELEYGLSYPDAAGRNLDLKSFSARVADLAPGGTISVIYRKKEYLRRISELPPPDFREESPGFVILRYRR